MQMLGHGRGNAVPKKNATDRALEEVKSLMLIPKEEADWDAWEARAREINKKVQDELETEATSGQITVEEVE